MQENEKTCNMTISLSRDRVDLSHQSSRSGAVSALSHEINIYFSMLWLACASAAQKTQHKM